MELTFLFTVGSGVSYVASLSFGFLHNKMATRPRTWKVVRFNEVACAKHLRAVMVMLAAPSGRGRGAHSPERSQTPQELSTAESWLDPRLGTETKNA